MKIQFLKYLSTLNVLCQLWTHIVNYEPYVSSFDPINRHSDAHNESSILVDLSMLNLLCQLWTHIVNSEPYVSSFDPITQHSGVHNETSVLSTFLNFEPFV